MIDPTGQRLTLPEHRRPRSVRRPTAVEEKAILDALPELADYVAGLKKHGRQHLTLAVRQLLRMIRDYPREALLSALREAGHYGLYDLERVERMVLRRIGHEYFRLDPDQGDDDDEDDLEQLLRNLRLTRILETYDALHKQAEAEDISYTDFLLRLLRAQWHARQEQSLSWRIRKARLPETWTLETFPYAKQPGVSRKQIRGFAELEFVAKAENLVFIGPTGVGKTGLASGLLLKALQNGYRGLFIKAQDLFDEMYASLADRSTRKLVDRLARVDDGHRRNGLPERPARAGQRLLQAHGGALQAQGHRHHHQPPL